MKIELNKVVNVHYTVYDEDGGVIDSTTGGGPLAYLHGRGNLVEGLEAFLEGKEVGFEGEVTIPPEHAYGDWQEEAIMQASRSHFDDAVKLEVGERVQAQGPDGPIDLMIISIEGDDVVLDGNHPLAGVTLRFGVKVESVEEAHPDEIKHGRLHAAGHHLMMEDSSFDEDSHG